MNTAAAPNAPAVPVSAPGTMRHASHAGLNARRLTSLRSGWNSLSPACVTPPQITTTSGLKILMKLATAAPSREAVSCTTSSAHSSPSFAASYTIWAVSFETSLGQYVKGDLTKLTAQIVYEAGLDTLHGSLRDRRSGRICLDAPVVPAFAAASVGVDRDVTEFARDVGHAVVDLAVDDDAAADSRAEGETDDVFRAACRAAPPLAEDGAIGVVID